MNRVAMVGVGSALALLGGAGRAIADGVELNDVILDGDHGTVHGRIDVPGGAAGGFSLKVRKAEVRDGELYLAGPLEVTFGRVTQTLTSSAMRLSDADGVCDVLAVTVPEMRLDHFGVNVDSAAVDIAVSATTSTGRALANLLCSATHLLDDPGPLTASSVPALGELINRALPRGKPHHNGKAQGAEIVEVPQLDDSAHAATATIPSRASRRGLRNHGPSVNAPRVVAPQAPAPQPQSGQYTASPYYPSPQSASPSAPAAATQSYPQPLPYDAVRPAQRRPRPARTADDDDEDAPSDD